MDAASLSSSPDLAAEELRRLVVELSGEVRALERRVDVLEHHTAPLLPPVPLQPIAAAEMESAANSVPALGRALLGIAGAYLLRALTEMGLLPGVAGIAMGILYAALWLWLASRSRTKFSGGLNASTSMVILAPLLWEALVRLHALPAWSAASVLTAFSVASLALAWRAKVPILASIVAPACAWTALLLLFGTQAVLPFVLAMTAIAAACEFARAPTRWMCAVAADIGVLLLVWLLGRGEPLPEGYPAVPIPAAVCAAALLAVIYVASAFRRTLIEGRLFSLFGIAQTAIAFLIGLGGAWYVTHANAPAAPVIISAISCAAGIGCYAILPKAGRGRNLYTFTCFAIVLTAAGTWLVAAGAILTAIWCALALAVFLINPGKLGNWNAGVYLWLAALGIATQAAPRYLIVLTAAAAVYVLLIRMRDERPSARMIAGAMVFAFLAAVITAVRVAAAATAILTLSSLALAWLGTREARRELVWSMYATMAAAAWMLIARDLQSPNTMRLVVSLLLFGGTLMLLPRILKTVRDRQSVRNQPGTGRG